MAKGRGQGSQVDLTYYGLRDIVWDGKRYTKIGYKRRRNGGKWRKDKDRLQKEEKWREMEERQRLKSRN